MSQRKRDFYDTTLACGAVGRTGRAHLHGRQAHRRILDPQRTTPARYTVDQDGLVVLASETGVLDIPPENVRERVDW